MGVAFSGAVSSGNGTRASPWFITTAAAESGGCCTLEHRHVRPGRSLSSGSVVCLGQAEPGSLLPYLSAPASIRWLICPSLFLRLRPPSCYQRFQLKKSWLQRAEKVLKRNLEFDCMKRELKSVRQANQDGVVAAERGGRGKGEIKPKFMLIPGDCSVCQG